MDNESSSVLTEEAKIRISFDRFKPAHAFSVWAPRALAASVKLGRDIYPLHRVDDLPPGDEWWCGEIPGAHAGMDYKFILNDTIEVPDPRSPWQPDGVHGPSRIVDHGAFHWTDAEFRPQLLAEAIVYELHIGTFTPDGTFESAIDRLEHLVDLGITHVEIMPVAEFPGGRGWGYDGVDLYAPHHAYGGPAGLKHLVNACHGKGLAVILDVVYNHLGPAGNYLNQFGPYFTDRYRTPWGAAMNFDGAGSLEVRRFVCDNAILWLRDYHIDGLRLDAIHAIFDTSAVHILEQIACEVEGLRAESGRDLVLIAESDLNDPRIIRPRDAGGYGLDAQWSDDFHHALHVALTHETSGYYVDFGGLPDVARALENGFVYDGRYSVFRRRMHGRPLDNLPRTHLLGYMQTHDQIGNRARGERSSHLMNTARLKIAAALVFTSPFVPMLFEGEEWGASTPFQYFTDHEDPDLAEAVSKGRRKEFEAFGYPVEEFADPQSIDTFLRSKLDYAEMERASHREILEWHRDLIRLRRECLTSTEGKLDVRFSVIEKWIVVLHGPLITACNLSAGQQRISMEQFAGARVLLASGSATLEGSQLRMSAESAAVLTIR